jgi:putative hydrolase of the HAD superfamily
MIRALLFDLDDTLYCENDFLASGYRAVAESLASACGRPWGDIHCVMMATLAREGRHAVMGAVLDQFPGSGFRVADLVDIYRSHVPQINLFPGYAKLLQELRASYRIGVITDGAPEVQKSKCAALGLHGIVDSILYTWDNGRDREKPHPLPFLQMLDRLRVTPCEALFIGDNLEKDIQGARGVGIRSVHVQKPPIMGRMQQEGDGSDFVVETLSQLPLILRQLEDQNEGA